MEIIKVSNLHTAFGDNIVHNDISFSVNEGEIFGKTNSYAKSDTKR